MERVTKYSNDQVDGQMSIFDILPARKINEENKCLGEPCMYCDTIWGSLDCFLKRGYIWDEVNRFAKGANGKRLRKSMETRECKKEYRNET